LFVTFVCDYDRNDEDDDYDVGGDGGDGDDDVYDEDGDNYSINTPALVYVRVYNTTSHDR
jgi:hypothetical protein